MSLLQILKIENLCISFHSDLLLLLQIFIWTKILTSLSSILLDDFLLGTTRLLDTAYQEAWFPSLSHNPHNALFCLHFDWLLIGFPGKFPIISLRHTYIAYIYLNDSNHLPIYKFWFFFTLLLLFIHLCALSRTSSSTILLEVERVLTIILSLTVEENISIFHSWVWS